MQCYEASKNAERQDSSEGHWDRRGRSRTARQIAEGLDHAARSRSVHRDIKPANMFVTNGGKSRFGFWGGPKLSTQSDSAGMYRNCCLHDPGKRLEKKEGIEADSGRSGVVLINLTGRIIGGDSGTWRLRRPT